MQDSAAKREVRKILTERLGFSLWVGPSQAPTPTHHAGVYLKGHVPLGTVVVRLAAAYCVCAPRRALVAVTVIAVRCLRVCLCGHVCVCGTTQT